MDKHEWLLKRNCSLSPRQLAVAYALLCAISFLIGMIFCLFGVWQELAFSTLEMVLVALAFLYYARHACDCEHIVLEEGVLLTEQMQAGQNRKTCLDPYWTRIVLPGRAHELINLESKGVKIAVGRFITQEKRQQIAQELRQQLRRSLSSAGTDSKCLPQVNAPPS